MKMPKILIFFIILIILISFLYFENNSIQLTKKELYSSKLPKDFEGFKIIQISDLHSKVFGKNNKDLVEKIRDEKPHIIVITGDLVDRRRYNEDKSLDFIDKIKDICPIYYVTGNHEAWSGKFPSLERKLKEREVNVLRNNKLTVSKGGDYINILGVDDPAFNTKDYSEAYKDFEITKNVLKSMEYDKEREFNILLSHRPELFDIYEEAGIDLVFAGHAHGGQINIPFIGGVIAPNQGFFPKYYKGAYNKNNTTMIVSRGLGNSVAPQRLFNRPEIISMTVYSK
ncbi:metallophosphoesterase [Desnuesiella massiliensis]|uniref:metallophosphoesterase n=1 Tax=Desnuesiella massiliensis TaxID=1650662 RepID=UPI0006E14BF7|nr:metallophosphoesterase [Desnuesiella massiliensis]